MLHLLRRIPGGSLSTSLRLGNENSEKRISLFPDRNRTTSGRVIDEHILLYLT